MAAAAKDTNVGMSSWWERFDFSKDAPLAAAAADDDETEGKFCFNIIDILVLSVDL